MVKGVEHIISTVVQWLRASNILYLPWCSGLGRRTYYIYRGAVVRGVEHIISTVVRRTYYIYRRAVVQWLRASNILYAVVKGVEHIISTVVQWLRASNISYQP